ncbi:ATPase, T2SS/T4P/T4SS family, partial [Holdemania massiliensis]
MEERLLALLRMAINQHATDLHFSIRNETVTLQMRCGIQIKDIENEPQDLKLFRYLQYRANLELSDRSRPQTGRFEMEVDGKMLALRFAVMHSLMLTSGVLRILNGTLNWTLAECCSDKKQTDLLKKG